MASACSAISRAASRTPVRTESTLECGTLRLGAIIGTRGTQRVLVPAAERYRFAIGNTMCVCHSLALPQLAESAMSMCKHGLLQQIMSCIDVQCSLHTLTAMTRKCACRGNLMIGIETSARLRRAAYSAVVSSRPAMKTLAAGTPSANRPRKGRLRKSGASRKSPRQESPSKW